MTQQPTGRDGKPAAAVGNQTPLIIISWAIVGIPILYALWQTLIQIGPLLGLK